MAEAMDMLRTLRTALAAVRGVQTCRIGLESTITPDDYPIVRIVPSALQVRKGFENLPFMSVRDADCLIYFGVAMHEFSGGDTEGGLEGLYEQLFELEAALIAALPRTGNCVARYVETVTDEDRSEGYKLMALRVTLTGQG